MQPDVTSKEEKRVEEVDHVEGDIALQSRRILKEHHFPPSWRVAWLGIFCQGFSVSVDIVLRKKLAEDPRYGLDVAIAVDDVKEVGHIMGYVVGSVLMQATGRVTALYLYGVGVVFGTLATVLCTTLPHVPTAFLICVFQAVAGVFGAVGSLTGYVYLSEVAPDEDRGIVAGIEHCCYLLGRLVANMFPSALPWQWLAVLSLAPSMLFVFLMRWTIESPRWFLQNRHKETIRRAAVAQEMASKPDVAPVHRPTQQPNSAAAPVPSGHSVKAAPSKGPQQPSAATGASAATFRRPGRRKGSEAFRGANSMGNPKRPF
ncbi:solute carrier family 2, facilitated glucose transporter member 8-like [Rhipicephalus microplus]|uniref:solute carrier family 2, facilitated glucose transporter member 8-like n=1 Tax=Rhipicephalus microplus TaxID=6941 RepID=UPI003F6B67D1